jgi:hypothetical protein
MAIEDPNKEFNDSFAEAIGETDETDTWPTPADSAAVAADNAQQPSEPGDGVASGTEPPEPGGDAVAEDDPGQSVGGGSDADSRNSADNGVDYAAELAALRAELEAVRNPPPRAEPQKAPELYSPEEIAELNTLKEDWPDLYRMFSLMARQSEAKVVNYTFSEMSKVLNPLQQTVNVITGNEHQDAIYFAHPDYDQVYNPCMQWIESQPAFIRRACEEVVASGTSEEVNTMIQRFKDETGWKVKPAPSSAPKTELSNAAKQAAKAIGAVGTKRGAATSAPDPSDFDAAWEEANAA